MGLASQIQKATQKALKAVGDIKVTLTYYSVTPGAYDPATDALSNTIVQHDNIPAVLVRAREEEMDWTPISTNVEKCLIAYLDLPITPHLTDYVVIGGVQWEVKRIKPVPGEALHVLFIQAP